MALPGQKNDTDVFGGTAEVLMSSGVVMMTNRSPDANNQLELDKYAWAKVPLGSY